MADLRNKFGDVVYRIEGNRIIDVYGNKKYEIRGEYIFDTYGNRKYEIRGEWLFDTYGNRLGETKNLADYLDPPDDSSSYSDSAPTIRRKKPQGCSGWLGFIIALIIRNWGGRIGLIVGIVLLIIIFVTEGNMDISAYILMTLFFPLLLGAIGAGIGAIIGAIIKTTDNIKKEEHGFTSEKEHQELAQEFHAMNDKDTTELASKCDDQYRILKERREEEKTRKAKLRKIIIAVVAVIILMVGGYYVYNSKKNSVTILDRMTVIREDNREKNMTNVDIPGSVNSINQQPSATSSNNTQQSQNNFQATHKVITNDGTNLRLRDAPGFDTSQIGSLKYGSSVMVLETGASAVDSDGYRGNWTYVSTPDGKTGWCFGAYLQLLPR